MHAQGHVGLPFHVIMLSKHKAVPRNMHALCWQGDAACGMHAACAKSVVQDRKGSRQ